MIFLRQRKACAALLLLSGFADASELSREQRVDAVKATIARTAECKKLGDFYWEIGDKNGVLESGAVGDKFSAQKIIPIASASKWVFGSYVLEKNGGKELTREQIRALEMTSGYTSHKHTHCILPRTTAECFHHRGNDEFTPEHADKFFYNGGHDQKLAVDMGLGDLTAKQFGEEIRQSIGRDIAIDFNSPQPAGGMKASPSDYGKFLRKILRGELRMHDYLGYSPVCTNPKSCQQAVYSPVPADWHYSLNHWVEDGSGEDGAFSSPGAFGFYPWITADKQTYGILAREDRLPNAAKESVYCGVKMRRAWVAGKSQ